MDLVFTGTTQNSMENSQTLRNLVEKVQAGQSEAFGQIYNLYFEKVYRFIFYRVSHKELAEDLAEEVFLKIQKKINGVKEAQAFEGWMYQIARNTVIDYYRSKKTLVSLDEVENTLEYETNV